MNFIKKEYAGSNRIPNLNELPTLIGSKSQIKVQIIQQLPIYLSIEKISKLAEDSPTLGDKKSENALEAVMRFNEDMRMLSLTSFQMQDLLESALQEHDQMIEWLLDLEQLTLHVEETIIKNLQDVKKVY